MAVTAVGDHITVTHGSVTDASCAVAPGTYTVFSMSSAAPFNLVVSEALSGGDESTAGDCLLGRQTAGAAGAVERLLREL
jgi:hypothetical protein